MSPKEKADELYKIYFELIDNSHWSRPDEFENSKSIAKKCAIVCVDEVLENAPMDRHPSIFKFNEYWQEVKSELEKL